MIKILFLLFFPFCVLANSIDTSCPNNVIWGAPVLKSYNNTQILCNNNYAVIYDYTKKTPIVVVEHLTPKNFTISTTRTNDFREDLRIPVKYRSLNSDYLKSGFDRGHLAPAGDFMFSKQAMSDSFLLSNMVPQIPANNRNIWKILEDHVRDLAAVNPDTYVITGVIFSAPQLKVGNGVIVPNVLYKIVIQPSTNTMLAFRIPNTDINSVNLTPYRVSVNSIEKLTGINFSPLIPVNLKALEYK